MSQCDTVTASVCLKARLFLWRRLLGNGALMVTKLYNGFS